MDIKKFIVKLEYELEIYKQEIYFQPLDEMPLTKMRRKELESMSESHFEEITDLIRRFKKSYNIE